MHGGETIEQRAAEFHRVHRSKDLGQWRYYVAGEGETVLLLPGGAGIGISWLDLAPALHPAYRTVTVDYPPTATTLAQLADGLLTILDAEGIGRVHLVGQSAGGMLAEVLIQRAPERVASVVFSGTGLYGAEDVDRLAGKVDTIRNTPWEQTIDAARTALRTVWQASPEGEFWLGQVEAGYRRSGRDGLANSLAMLLDLARHSGDLRPGWDGPARFLAAEDDLLITATHRQRLLDLHPGHTLRLFPDGGHSLLLTRAADYLAEVRAHLAALA